MLVPRKGTENHPGAKIAVNIIDQLGHNRVTLRCDTEPAIEALARESQGRGQTVPERPTVGESQSNGIIVRTVGGCIGASHWSIVLAPKSRLVQGYYAGWWSSLRI